MSQDWPPARVHVRWKLVRELAAKGADLENLVKIGCIRSLVFMVQKRAGTVTMHMAEHVPRSSRNDTPCPASDLQAAQHLTSLSLAAELALSNATCVCKLAGVGTFVHSSKRNAVRPKFAVHLLVCSNPSL